MQAVLLMGLLVFSFSGLAEERKLEIQKWDTVTAEKGYILSNDLFFNKMCSKIWTKQVQEFKKENPHIKNPDLILIDETIKVQDCRMQEADVAMVEDKEEVVVVKKEKKKSPYFAIVSAEYNTANEKGANVRNEGGGLKIELGRYFEMKEDQKIKASLGMLFNKTNFDDGDGSKSERIVTTLDGSYLFKMSENIHLGPAVGMFLSPKTTFETYPNSKDDALAVFVGGNAEYKLSEKIHVDFKLQNAVDNRVNVMTSLGLGYNF
jgi:hypothetical protein